MRTPWELDLPDAIAAYSVMNETLPIVDVGSGSGTPGILVACIQPDHPVILVEPIAKRTAFLRLCVARLSLKNVVVRRERWPCSLPDDAVQVISRAVVSPEEWPPLATSRSFGKDHLVRMLAAHRPAVELPGYLMRAQTEYTLGIHGTRIVERWEPGGNDP